jgi:putative peptidoglycan lipid II flippase
MIPASVAFMVLAKPMVTTLFGGGKFDQYSAGATAGALLFYSIGLFAYGGTRLLQSCFFALKDTVTPTKISGLSLVMNIILNAALMFSMKIAGIALATSISGIISFTALSILLEKRIGDFGNRKIIFSALRILLASLCMGAICYLISHNLFGMNKFILLGLEIIAGALTYVLFCIIFRVREMKELWLWVSKKK